MKLPEGVTICEVGTRDGFQIEPDFIVGRALPGQIVKAGTATRRYPVSDGVAARIPRGT